MALLGFLQRPLESPLKSLLVCFLSWKVLLLAIAATSPGIGYDTSTSILFNQHHLRDSRNANPSAISNLLNAISTRLVRWDAIYFVNSARRGHVHEQEWAFSWAYARFMSWIAQNVSFFDHSITGIAAIGILFAHVMHLLSVLLLYRTALLVEGPSSSGKVAFISAALHIISPAGLFLSAPYAEAPFSCLNFAGFLLYLIGFKARSMHESFVTESIGFVGAGIFFALASLLRSNGILSGAVFAYDALVLLVGVLHDGVSMRWLQQAAITLIGGALIPIGLIVPQWVAYHEYCVLEDHERRRTWCARLIPSIYTWVQDHYWNVGFLRYWTLSNAPLFLLAAPTITLLLLSGSAVFSTSWKSLPETKILSSSSKKPSQPHLRSPEPSEFCTQSLRRLALPQVLLALLALTNFHVQVITRIASGYPLWYIICGRWLCAQSRKGSKFLSSQSVVFWMVIYAVVQGGLFASFLPPA